MIVKVYAIEIIFNGIYFHNHFYLKTGTSRNGLSLGYSEQDTSSVRRCRCLQLFCTDSCKILSLFPKSFRMFCGKKLTEDQSTFS